MEASERTFSVSKGGMSQVALPPNKNNFGEGRNVPQAPKMALVRARKDFALRWLHCEAVLALMSIQFVAWPSPTSKPFKKGQGGTHH